MTRPPRLRAAGREGVCPAGRFGVGQGLRGILIDAGWPAEVVLEVDQDHCHLARFQLQQFGDTIGLGHAVHHATCRTLREPAAEHWPAWR